MEPPLDCFALTSYSLYEQDLTPQDLLDSTKEVDRGYTPISFMMLTRSQCQSAIRTYRHGRNNQYYISLLAGGHPARLKAFVKPLPFCILSNLPCFAWTWPVRLPQPDMCKPPNIKLQNRKQSSSLIKDEGAFKGASTFLFLYSILYDNL
jgi:hypothetical protein